MSGFADGDDIELDRLKVRQIIADIDQKRADIQLKLIDIEGNRQQLWLAPMALAVSCFAASAAVLGAGAALFKFLR